MSFNTLEVTSTTAADGTVTHTPGAVLEKSWSDHFGTAFGGVFMLFGDSKVHYGAKAVGLASATNLVIGALLGELWGHKRAAAGKSPVIPVGV